MQACLINRSFSPTTPLEKFVADSCIELTNYGGESWIVADKAHRAIRERIEQVGTPLKNWDIQINYGIKTGYNKAFIIDTKTRERILATCQNDEEKIRTTAMIKPILRGRDIKKYQAQWAGLWLIFIPWHFPLQKDNSITGNSQKAENIFKKEYPAIYNHLLKYKEVLSKRNKAETGIRYEWYTLQRCANTYYPEFAKEKIVWQRITQEPTFCISPNNQLVLDSMAFLSSFHKRTGRYILSILNSKLVAYWVDKNVHQYGNTGYRLSNQYVEEIPIPKLSAEQQKPFESLVDYILLTAATNNPSPAARYFEKIIDALVYQLYFPQELKAAGKIVLPHLGNLPALSDTMSEAAKLAIIKDEYQRLSHPDHPVPHILDTLHEIEVVHTILHRC